MRKATTVAMEEWLADAPPSPAGHTLAELSALMGPRPAARAIRQAADAGRLIVAWREGKNVMGRMCRTPVYRLSDSGKSAGKGKRK